MLLQPITVPFSKSTLKPSVYTLSMCVKEGAISWAAILSNLVFRSKTSKQVLSFKLSMDL